MAIKASRHEADGEGEETRGGECSLTRQWYLHGSNDHATMRSYALGNIFADSEMHPSGVWMQLESLSHKYHEDLCWLWSGKYNSKRPLLDEYRLSIDANGGSVRVSTSFATSRHAASGKTAPDFQGAIDVRDGKPQGVDRVIPAQKLTVNYRMNRPADINAFTYLAQGLVGTTNSNAMLSYSAGELLFVGMTGDWGSADETEMQFSWVASKDAQLTLATIPQFTKAGHDYVWILYEPAQDAAAANYITQRPRAAYVERIYTREDHSTLGLLL